MDDMPFFRTQYMHWIKETVWYWGKENRWKKEWLYVLWLPITQWGHLDSYSCNSWLWRIRGTRLPKGHSFCKGTQRRYHWILNFTFEFLIFEYQHARTGVNISVGGKWLQSWGGRPVAIQWDRKEYVLNSGELHGCPWYSLSQRLLQINNIQPSQPEECVVTIEPGCLSMMIWAMASSPEEVEAKCEGNLKYILLEKHDEYQLWIWDSYRSKDCCSSH